MCVTQILDFCEVVKVQFGSDESMQYLFYLLLCLILIVLQTTILPNSFGSLRFYDLIIPVAIYFSLYRPFREGFPVLLLAALAMDMISGAPAGIYLTTYIWLFLAFRQTWRFFDVKHSYFYPVLVVIGVLFQLLIFWVVISIHAGHVVFTEYGIRLVFFQVFLVVITAPFIFPFLQMFFGAADRLFPGRAIDNG